MRTSAGSGTSSKLQRAAVEQQRVPGLAEAGHELVHDAAAHADEIVLGLAARQRASSSADRSGSRSCPEARAGGDSSAAEELKPGAMRDVAVDRHSRRRAGACRAAASTSATPRT